MLGFCGIIGISKIEFFDFSGTDNRIFSAKIDFKTHISHMEECFLARCYPEIVLNNQIDKKMHLEKTVC